MRRLLVLGSIGLLAALFGASCYGPHIQAGSPCSLTEPCPSPLVCSAATSTCEAMGSGSELHMDAPRRDAANLVDASLAPVNDLPQNATALTQTTTITEDITYAHDDASGDGTLGCGGSGGRDVFFEVHNGAMPQTWYFDTFGSTYDTVIRVYRGDCAGGMQPSGTVCDIDACSTTQSQVALELPAATSCIVVDENSTGSGSGSNPTPAKLTMRVERSGRTDGVPLNASALTSSLSGNTCTNATSLWTGACGGSGDEDAYFFTVCPNTTQHLMASTCNAGTPVAYATDLYVRQISTNELACSVAAGGAVCPGEPNASVLSGIAVTGPHLFWLVVDSEAGSGSSSCGAYSLSYSLQ